MTDWPINVEIHEQGGAMWLIELLDAALPDLKGGARDELAARIVAAVPRDQLALEIAVVTSVELKRRGITDEAGDIARVIGTQAASIIAALGGR